MVARLVKQDNTIKKEFLKKIQDKIDAEKEVLQEYKEKKPSSLFSSLRNAMFGDPSDKQRKAAQQKGNMGEAEVAVKLRVGLTEDWVLMNVLSLSRSRMCMPRPTIY